MSFGIIKKIATSMVVGVAATSLAFGQANCTETTFSAKNGDLYLKAENELINTKNFAAAQAFVTQLEQGELNCYEANAISLLRVQVLVSLGDYPSAARALEQRVNGGLVPKTELKQMYRILADLNMQIENLPKALDFSNRWLREGGRPDRAQKYQLAVLNEKAKKYPEAIRWAEDIYKIEGANVKDDVVQLLFYLYQETGNTAKRAKLLEDMIKRDPKSEKYWSVLRSDLFQNDRLRGFQAYRAMYHAGLVTKKNDVMQLVDLYNEFEVFYHGASLLEKEMNSGRLPKNFENLKKLADLYQFSSEFKRAIPVLQQAAEYDSTGKTYERIARSYLDVESWKEAENWALKALEKGRLASASQTWLMIGRARYNDDNRTGAREAFAKAGSPGRDFVAYMKYEDTVACDTKVNAVEQVLYTIRKDIDRCKKLIVLGEQNAPESCKGDTNAVRLAEEEAKLEAVSSCRRRS